jgi:N-acetylmuramoyl-L-alanine amidase
MPESSRSVPPAAPRLSPAATSASAEGGTAAASARRPRLLLMLAVGLAATSFAPPSNLAGLGSRSPDPHAPAVDPDLDPHAPAVGVELAAGAHPRRGGGVATTRDQRPDRHVVKPGDTVAALAEEFGVSSAELARANAVRDPRALQPGRTLMIPDPDAPRPLTPAQATAADLPAAAALEAAAARFGWRPDLIKAIAWAESRWNHRLVSPAGAVGVMQVRPATAAFMATALGEELDVYDLEQNAIAGVAYLDHLHGRLGGDVRRILAAYHQGEDSLARNGVLPSSERYIAQVLAVRSQFAR